MKLVASALAVVAMVGVLLWTEGHGPGLSPDSVSYLYAAQSLAHGQAPRVPYGDWNSVTDTPRLSHFPPGFPALVALPASLGLDTIQAARLILIAAAGANVALSALAAGHVAGILAAAFAGLMVLLTPMIARSHAIVLSEPVFLFLLLLTLVLMVRAPTRAWSLGVVVSAAVLVRYAGVALVFAAALWMLWQPGAWTSRLRKACLSALPALIALTLWKDWSGHFRRYGYRPGVSANLQEAWLTVTAWLAPGLARSALQAALAMGVLLGVALVLNTQARASANAEDGQGAAFSKLLRACLLIAGCYVAVVFASRLFADPAIPFDWRLLAPVMLVTEIAFSAALVLRWNRWARARRTFVGAIIALWLLGSGWALAKYARDQYLRGWDYDAPVWQRSQFALWLRTDGGRYALYSNNPVAIWHLVPRTSRLLPVLADEATLRQLSKQLRRTPSALLDFSEPFTETLPIAELAHRLGLSSALRFDQATVWFSEEGTPHTLGGPGS